MRTVLPLPERYQEIDLLFEAVLERPVSSREAFLAEASGEDPALATAVQALLDSGAEAELVLGDSVTAFAVPLLDAWREEAAAVGRLGAYRIIEEIGRGGMGAVYLAERADQVFEKRVAIKLVKRGMDTDEVLHRFRIERQILASLEHPAIARLYDGGVSEDGRPYLVMEYIAGRPLIAYCDEHGLGTEERLALFQQVCRAVQYAHQNLVVHRDLKPSNVLVTETGEVKLLDFGIAKLLDAGAPGASDTRTEARLLTPDYASPEQLSGRPVTTASDLYSLGIVLYELLTGQRPFQRPAKRPSTAVTSDRLRRRLRGDLDTIVGKALEADPDRRYASASALLDDIDRHLNGQPVMARGDTKAYRAAKFVRRHRAGVLAAALVLMSLIGGLGVALWQAGNAARQAERAERERDVAQGVSAFLEGLFKAPDPFAQQERLDTLRIRDFLAQGTAKVQQELKEQPAVEARMLHVLGEVYHNLGSPDQARPLLEQSLELRLRLHGAESAEVAETQTKLGILRRDQGDYAAAESLLGSSLAIRQRLYGAGNASVGETQNELAALRRLQGRFDDAVRLHHEALASLRGAAGKPDLRVILGLNELVSTLGEKGDLDSAVHYAGEQLTVSRAVYGDDHPWVALALGNRAAQLQRRGDYDAAEQDGRASLSIAERTLGPKHPWVGEMQNIVGLILYRQRKYEEAESLYGRSLAQKRQQYDGPTQSLAAGMFNLALLLRAKGELDSAEAVNRASLAMMREVVGDDHQSVAMQTAHLAVILQAKGDCQGAMPLFAEAIAGIQRNRESDQSRVPQLQSEMGGCLTTLRRYTEAESLLVSSYGALAEGQREAAARAALERVVALYTVWGKPERAREYRGMLGDSAAVR